MTNRTRAWCSWLGCSLVGGFLAVAYSGPTLLYTSIVKNTGCSGGQFGLIFSAIGVGLLLGNLIVGKLLERNIKLFSVLGGLSPMILYGAIYFSKNIYIIIGAGFIFGILFQWCGNTLLSIVMARWFNKGRGTLLSIAFIIQSIFQIIFNPLLGQVILNIGGLNTALYIGVIFSIISMLLMGFLVSRFPEYYHMQAIDALQRKNKQADKQNQSNFESILTVRQMITTPVFMVLALSVFLISMGSVVYFSNATMIFQSFGLEYGQAVQAQSVYGIFAMLMNFLIGIFVDRIGVRKSVTIFAFLGSLGCFVPSLLNGWTGVAIFALLLNGAAVWTLMAGMVLPLIFGVKASSSLMGYLNFMGSLCSIIMGPVATSLYAKTGSYTSAFYIAGIGSLIGVVLVWWALSNKSIQNIRKRNEDQVVKAQ